MKPTEEEIVAEIATLKDYAPRIRQKNMFGQSNREKIDAQIATLEALPKDLTSRYEPDETADEYEETDWEVFNESKDAFNWATQGMGDKPSDGWKDLLQ